MVSYAIQKVTKEHLHRKAYLYVRQSTLRQIRVHQESTKRQYALQQQAMDLGWHKERIVVIDDDQGHSGVSTATRKGFQRLVAEVSLGKAGIVLGLEVSRLARNNSDWHKLLEICGLAQTLILDEDGLYDPCDFNDRLLLGLKGTFSEAELHVLKSRMRGGLLNKAQRGELCLPLPVGFVYDSENKVVFDPDKQVQQSVRLLFETYRRIGTIRGTVCYFNNKGLLFPRHSDNHFKEKLEWKKINFSLARCIFRNPVYAGAYVFGRTRMTKRADGSISYGRLPREQWKVLIKNAHEGYISWDEYEKNQRQILSCTQSRNGLNGQGPPREGSALLQGLVICGICGKRMKTHYYSYSDRSISRYSCIAEQHERGGSICQSASGKEVDRAVGKLLMESVTPLTLEVALSVQKELKQRLEEVDKIRRQQLERAQYEANLAERQYMLVDPENRLVVGSLESRWNKKLHALEQAKEEYERICKEDNVVMNEKKQKDILALATDFPRLWQNPNVSNMERKRMIRLLIEDVTLLVGKDITVHVRFKGGATKTLSVPKPMSYAERRKTNPEIIKEIDRLLDHHIVDEVAKLLNEQGFRSGGDGLLFTGRMVATLQRYYGLKSRYERLREKGMLEAKEVAEKLNVNLSTLRGWLKKDLLKKHAYAKRSYLFELPANKDYGEYKNSKTKRSWAKHSTLKQRGAV
jgi:DNA invertase Pin-like site-specific DNA recombinase